ncbi:MAG: hypothetical protein JWL81_3123 [Verrucomicrobiales bacterium]|nr:hypothetical protein [Verrucomicrobiales bacterium]
MTGPLLEELKSARLQRRPCFLITLAATTGSVPRRAGAKMIVYPNGAASGTIGGGKFESLVLADALALPRHSPPLLKTYPLHEASPDSFGAVCGGEVTVLIEPQNPPPALTLVGAGHCSRALAALATTCGWHVTVIDDRAEELENFPADLALHRPDAPAFISGKSWQSDDALVLISRNYQLDRDALAAALRRPGFGYLGMIGSQRKVRRVRDELLAEGFKPDDFSQLRAPLGLDLGADHPAEIAVSILAEILTLFNRTSGAPLSLIQSPAPPPAPAPTPD